jgi:hypothetical protein
MFEKILINDSKKVTKSDILNRIKDLHYLQTKAGNDIIDLEAVEKIFQKENI